MGAQGRTEGALWLRRPGPQLLEDKGQEASGPPGATALWDLQGQSQLTRRPQAGPLPEEGRDRVLVCVWPASGPPGTVGRQAVAEVAGSLGTWKLSANVCSAPQDQVPSALFPSRLPRGPAEPAPGGRAAPEHTGQEAGRAVGRSGQEGTRLAGVTGQERGLSDSTT